MKNLIKLVTVANICGAALYCCSDDSSSKQDERQNKRLNVLEQKQEAQEVLIDNLKNTMSIKDSQMEQVTEELAKISDELDNAKSEQEIATIKDDLDTINSILAVLNHQVNILESNPVCKAVGSTSYKVTKTLTINVPNIQCTGDSGHETIVNDIDNKNSDKDDKETTKEGDGKYDHDHGGKSIKD